MRGLFSGRRVVVSSPQMCRMRPHRLLRCVTQPACVETQRGDRSPCYHELRAGRAMVLRLSDGRGFRRPEASGPSIPSIGSAGARAGWGRAFRLANTAPRLGNSSGHWLSIDDLPSDFVPTAWPRHPGDLECRSFAGTAVLLRAPRRSQNRSCDATATIARLIGENG